MATTNPFNIPNYSYIDTEYIDTINGDLVEIEDFDTTVLRHNMTLNEFKSLSNERLSEFFSRMFNIRCIVGEVWRNGECKGRGLEYGNNSYNLDHVYEYIFMPILNGVYKYGRGVHEHLSNYINAVDFFLLTGQRVTASLLNLTDSYCIIIDGSGMVYYMEKPRSMEKVEVDIEEYRKQKAEEERIKREEERKKLLPELVKSMTNNIKNINKNKMISIAIEILNAQSGILKSKGIKVPFILYREYIYVDGYGQKNISDLSFDNIKTLYKSLILEDFDMFFSVFGERKWKKDIDIEAHNIMIQELDGMVEFQRFEDIDFDKLIAISKYLFETGRTIYMILQLDIDGEYIKGTIKNDYSTRDNNFNWNRENLRKILKQMSICIKCNSGDRIKLGSTWYDIVVAGRVYCKSKGNIDSIESYYHKPMEFMSPLTQKRYENSFKDYSLDFKSKIDELKKLDSGNISDEAEAKILSLMQDHEIEDVYFENESIVLRTVPLYINQYYSSINYTEDMLIGRFLIKISLRNVGDVKVFKPYAYSNGQAPHVFADGTFCTGQYNTIMYDSARNYEYTTMLHYTLQHLTTYNASSPANNINNFIQSIETELLQLEKEGFVKTRPLSGFSLPVDGGFITPSGVETIDDIVYGQ